MTAKSTDQHPVGGPVQHSVEATRRDVIARLTDPYLTDHDRWVLGQFASFLGGQAPGPDPRVAPRLIERPLCSRARRSTL